MGRGSGHIQYRGLARHLSLHIQGAIACPKRPKNLIVGFDVGSTTVKSVVVDTTTDQIIWSDYQRHDTKQPEKCLEFLKRMEAEAGIKAGRAAFS